MAGPSSHVRFILLKENYCQDYYITVFVSCPNLVFLLPEVD